MTDYAAMPDTLPIRPTGWTMRMTMHINFGGGKGAASSNVFDPSGRQMPFTHGYNTNEKWRGFLLPGVEPVLSWKELCEIWPKWIRRARAKQTAAVNKQLAGTLGKVEPI